MTSSVFRSAVAIAAVALPAFISGCVDCNCRCLFPDSGGTCCVDAVADTTVHNDLSVDNGRDEGSVDAVVDTGNDVVGVDMTESVEPDVVAPDVPVDEGQSDDGGVIVDVISDLSADVSDVSSDICADGDPCDDGDPCTDGDQCQGGACVPGGPLCSTFENCESGVCKSKMITVPTGSFYMGCNLSVTAPADCGSDEFPYHVVITPQYRIDAIEVTNVAFAAFLNSFGNTCAEESCVWWSDTDTATGLTWDGSTWGVKPGMEEYPVDNVSRQGAGAYCEWAGRSLCTEAQWEKAARGGCEYYASGRCGEESYMFPWGNEAPNCYLVNWGECGASIAPVGSKFQGASLYGVLDMSGNLWEWVADASHTSYNEAPTDGSAWGTPGPGVDGMLRGGGYNVMYARVITASNRSRQPLARDQFLVRPGFRCCEVTAP